MPRQATSTAPRLSRRVLLGRLAAVARPVAVSGPAAARGVVAAAGIEARPSGRLALAGGAHRGVARVGGPGTVSPGVLVDRSVGRSVGRSREPAPDSGAVGSYAAGAVRRLFQRVGPAGERRALATAIWYPAAPEAAAAAPTHDAGLRAPFTSAPDRSADPYPVELFLHGSGGTPWQSTFLTTHLASHGFVVVAPPPRPARPPSRLRDQARPDLPLAREDGQVPLGLIAR